MSIRWEGYIRPLTLDSYTFALDIDDHARLWIDGNLLLNSWAFSPTSDLLYAEHDLTALGTHEVVIEYRNVLGDATARLLWSATSTPPSALPTVDQQLKDWKAIAECKSKKNAEVLKILRKRATQSHEDQKIRLNTAFNLKVRTRATRRTEP